MQNTKKILIAVPITAFCEPETMQSIYNMKLPFGISTELVFMKGYSVTQARNRLAALSLHNQFDYTFFVDGDVILPEDTLQKLVAIDAPVATGWYIKKIQDGLKIAELYRQKDGGWENLIKFPNNTIIDVSGCGFGCTLVKNEVFQETRQDNAFWFEYIETPKMVCSEDLAFCRKVLNHGYQIKADTSVHCRHIGQYLYDGTSCYKEIDSEAEKKEGN
jgi:hypothetical protein